jgi:uncharacterized membrane protein (UPF0127 family)
MRSENSSNAAIYSLTNSQSGLRLAGRVCLAGESRLRRKGLMGVEAMDREAGLWIMPCEAIHTFGMKMPIDVVFLDRKYKVRKLREGMRPGRVAVCLQATSVVELRSGAIAESQTKLGDQVQVRRVVDDDAANAKTSASLDPACLSS